MGAGNNAKGASQGYTTRITDVDGSELDLTDSPLQYGEKLSIDNRAQIDAFEAKRRGSKIEFSIFFDEDGKVIGKENRGGKGSVKHTLSQAVLGRDMSHNHPRGAGSLGGTFSSADVSNFCNSLLKSYGAAAKEGSYRIVKGANFDKSLARAYAQAERGFDREYEQAIKSINNKLGALNDEFRRGNLSRESYDKQFDATYKGIQKEFNKTLVKMHNWLIDNQSTYGYSYSLEKS